MPTFIERDPPPDWMVMAPQEELLREHLNRWVKRVNALFEVVKNADYADPHAVYGRVEADLHPLYNFIDQLNPDVDFTSQLGELVRTFSVLEALTEKLQERVETEYAEIDVEPDRFEAYALKTMPAFLAQLKSAVSLLTPSHVTLQAHLEVLVAYCSFFTERARREALRPLREAHAEYFRRSELSAVEAYREGVTALSETEFYRRHNQTASGNPIAGAWMEKHLAHYWDQLEVQSLLLAIDD